MGWPWHPMALPTWWFHGRAVAGLAEPLARQLRRRIERRVRAGHVEELTGGNSLTHPPLTTREATPGGESVRPCHIRIQAQPGGAAGLGARYPKPPRFEARLDPSRLTANHCVDDLQAGAMAIAEPRWDQLDWDWSGIATISPAAPHRSRTAETQAVSDQSMTAGICAHLLKLERDLAIKGKTAWAPGAEKPGAHLPGYEKELTVQEPGGSYWTHTLTRARSAGTDPAHGVRLKQTGKDQIVSASGAGAAPTREAGNRPQR